jgi:hypothetical protein
VASPVQWSAQTVKVRDLGDGTESLKPSGNVLPDVGVKVVCVPEVLGAIPAVATAEPINPGGGGVKIEFGEEFC